MKRVLVRGPLLSQSGYGVHSRQIFRFCESNPDWQVTTEILPWGITPWNVNSEYDDGVYGSIMAASQPVTSKFDISFQIQLPHEWNADLASYNVGVTAGVETTACSTAWAVEHCNKMDLVITPSQFTKNTLKRSANNKCTTPIEVLPEAYFSKLLEDAVSDPLEDLPTSKNILMIGTLTSDAPEADRKNLVNSIMWFTRAFAGKKDVGLIVKTSRGRDTTIDRDLVRKLLKQIRKNCGINEKNIPKIYMLHGPMNRTEMRDLYKSPKLCAFASATRGEGFGLPLLEAAVSGLPIVATNWSAHTEFLKGESFLSTVYDMRKIPKSRVDNAIFVEDACWAEPREGNFTRKLKLAVTDNKKYKAAAQGLASDLQQSHSLESLQSKFRSIISEYYK